MTTLDYAISQARQIDYESGQRRVFSVVVDKRGRILSESANSYSKSHPIQAHFAERVDLPDKIYLHAEIASLIKVRYGEPYKIFIARVDSEGNPVPGAPCPICELAIKESGVKSVEYTI